MFVLKNSPLTLTRKITRAIISIGFLLLIAYGCRLAVRAGLSRLYSVAVVKGAMFPGTDSQDLLNVAEESSRLASSDPDAFRARGIAQMAMSRPAEAAKEFYHAVSLRPRHYLLWLDLGRALDQSDDIDGAIKALQESVKLAPFFAQPRWELANVLFRAERYDEAFVELRHAIAGDATRLPLSLEMAWAASRGDAQKFQEMIVPTSPSARLMVGRFLAKHGKPREAVQLFHSTGGIAEADQRALVKELVAAKQFVSAYEVWSSGRSAAGPNTDGLASVTDGGFENKIIKDDPGFGWQVNVEVPTARISVETTVRQEGARSLRLEWNGDSNSFSQLVTQTVLVSPNTQYVLTFQALGKGLVSGGMPVIVVSDASSNEYKALAESQPISDGERDWMEYKIEFKSGEKSEAVLVTLQRRPCASNQCPIFGRLWLDAFQMKKV